MSTEVKAIRSVSIRHSAADAIRTSLREGHIKAGENINEMALATQFEVSRGPIREALLVRVEEGLMIHTPNRGFSVINLSPDDHAHIVDLRLLLELRALERARERVSKADLIHLTQMKGQLVQLFRNSELPARDAIEISFHGYIWELSGNPWLAKSLKRAIIPLFILGRNLRISRASMDPASNLVTVPIFGLFIMAWFVPFVTPLGAMVGTLCSVVAAILIGFWDGLTGQPAISFQYIGMGSLVVSLAVGCFVSRVGPRRGDRAGVRRWAWRRLCSFHS
jgi:DNA-binding GntR family transcriptional regulator